jgi:hypothetical protein
MENGGDSPVYIVKGGRLAAFAVSAPQPMGIEVLTGTLFVGSSPLGWIFTPGKGVQVTSR